MPALSFEVGGFGTTSGPGFDCVGDGGGGSVITESETGFSAGGSISGSATCDFDDGTTETFDITGSFSASAAK